jgi:D-alanine-D-alanine ligase-like ATP-grasp enzyme
MKEPFASMLIEEIAPSMNIKVELEPEFKFAGELIFPNGRRHLFRNTNFNVNPAGSVEIVKDKGYTCYFLRKHGINTPENRAFFSKKLNSKLSQSKRRGLEDSILYASKIGFPVFVKPNNMSQGNFVTKAYLPQDILDAGFKIFEKTEVFLVEQTCNGNDYRIVVLGDNIISAYERIPLAIIGDGLQTIEQLLSNLRDELERLNRPNYEINILDPRIDICLKRIKRKRESIPANGERVVLLDNANLSSGGTSVDVTNSIHSSFSEIAIHATKSLGLKLCGVDIIAEDITTTASDQVWNVIELNAAPGLDNYASLGSEQASRVENLYREILKFLSD